MPLPRLLVICYMCPQYCDMLDIALAQRECDIKTHFLEHHAIVINDHHLHHHQHHHGWVSVGQQQHEEEEGRHAQLITGKVREAH